MSFKAAGLTYVQARMQMLPSDFIHHLLVFNSFVQVD